MPDDVTRPSVDEEPEVAPEGPKKVPLWAWIACPAAIVVILLVIVGLAAHNAGRSGAAEARATAQAEVAEAQKKAADLQKQLGAVSADPTTKHVLSAHGALDLARGNYDQAQKERGQLQDLRSTKNETRNTAARTEATREANEALRNQIFREDGIDVPSTAAEAAKAETERVKAEAATKIRALSTRLTSAIRAKEQADAEVARLRAEFAKVAEDAATKASAKSAEDLGKLEGLLQAAEKLAKAQAEEIKGLQEEARKELRRQVPTGGTLRIRIDPTTGEILPETAPAAPRPERPSAPVPPPPER